MKDALTSPEAANLRRTAGLSKTELGRLLGAARGTVERWEGQEMIPNAKHVAQWRALLPQLRRLARVREALFTFQVAP